MGPLDPGEIPHLGYWAQIGTHLELGQANITAIYLVEAGESEYHS